MPCDLRSDNVHGCSPEIMEAIARANAGTATSYGSDEITRQVRDRCSDLFEKDVEIYPVVTGTAANSMSIAALTPPNGAVLCHEDAHIVRDEFGAPEFFSGGAKLITIAGADGKLWPDALRAPTATTISVTNVTEAGTLYSADEVRAIHEATPSLRMHIDGARFANAVVATGASPADLTWRAGADLLSFGATKNGALAAELIVLFRKELADDLALRHIRAGQRLSKMRFLSAQFDAYLTDDLWLRHARHANAMASYLGSALAAAGIEIVRPVQANIVFVRFDADLVTKLNGDGFLFYDWPIFGPDVYRLVTAFSTTAEELDEFTAAISLHRTR